MCIYEQMYQILLYIIGKHLKDQWKDSLDTLKTKWSQLISLVTHILPFLMLRPESNSLQHLWSLLLGNDKLFINETDMIMKFITLTRSSNFLLKILSLIFQVRQWNGILQPCNWFDCLYAIKRQIKTISRSFFHQKSTYLLFFGIWPRDISNRILVITLPYCIIGLTYTFFVNWRHVK